MSEGLLLGQGVEKWLTLPTAAGRKECCLRTCGGVLWGALCGVARRVTCVNASVLS